MCLEIYICVTSVTSVVCAGIIFTPTYSLLTRRIIGRFKRFHKNSILISLKDFLFHARGLLIPGWLQAEQLLRTILSPRSWARGSWLTSAAMQTPVWAELRLRVCTSVLYRGVV